MSLVCQTHHAQQVHAVFLGLFFAFVVHHFGSIGHILKHRHVLEQVEMLEHHAFPFPYVGDFHARFQDVLPIEVDGSLVRPFQQVQAPKQGGFAGAGRPDDGHHLPFSDVQVDVFQHFQIAEMFGQMFYFNH